MDRPIQYPHHLAKLVAGRLRADGEAPPETVLARLLETLYFASLQTDEGKRVLCTVSYVDPEEAEREPLARTPPGRWCLARFDHPLAFDVRTLRKLSRAADPSVASLAVFADRKRNLFVWGLVDQEPRHGDTIALAGMTGGDRPGAFQVRIAGPGHLSVYRAGRLVGGLAQNMLVEEHPNVLWTGPVHAILKQSLNRWLEGYWRLSKGPQESQPEADEPPVGDDYLRDEFLLRWVNTVSRLLVNVQNYRQGGGLLIVPEIRPEALSVRYPLSYERLPKAILGLVESHLRRSRDRKGEQVARYLEEIETHKGELLGAIRFVAALCNADGVAIVDQGLCVRGFGVELQANVPLVEAHVAGDAQGTRTRLRRVDLAHFGTRHRAMMRYCYAYPGALGFAVSQDGEIRAMTRLDDRLVLWENIDVQLAFFGANHALRPPVYTQFFGKL